MAVRRSTHLLARAFNRPEGYLVGAFSALIVLGTILLAIPPATEKPIRLVDAFFTSTSAVCVTGLVVRDTGTDFTRFGQTVILILIQLGGLGIMTFGALVIQAVGHRLSFRSQAALHDVFYQRAAAARFRTDLKWIISLTLVIEALGAILLYAFLPPTRDRGREPFVAVFHSVSAFCNAGFSTYPDLTHVRGNVAFVAVIALLIVLGGLGYSVMLELLNRTYRRARGRPNTIAPTLNTRVVLTATGALIVLGMAVLAIFGVAPGARSVPFVLGNALFQSITARTAGFNTVDIGQLPLPSLLWLTFLMFVGGSPGSCAGGVKTTTLAVWAARLKSRLFRRDDVTIGGRRLPVDLVRRTGLLVGVAAIYNLVGVLILAITETPATGMSLEHLVFEQISAFATVGLSTGITPDLTILGKLWIIITMFVGRLGPLTIALVILELERPTVRMPEERLMVG